MKVQSAFERTLCYYHCHFGTKKALEVKLLLTVGRYRTEEAITQVSLPVIGTGEVCMT